jgi:hypothetical protein
VRVFEFRRQQHTILRPATVRTGTPAYRASTAVVWALNRGVSTNRSHRPTHHTVSTECCPINGSLPLMRR